MEEPSVLDYLKSRLAFWRTEKITIPMPSVPEIESMPDHQTQVPISEQPETVQIRERVTISYPKIFIRFPIITLGSLLFAFLAQAALEPPGRASTAGGIFYFLAAWLLLWSVWRGEISPVVLEERSRRVDDFRLRTIPLTLGVVFAVVAFLAFGNGLFNGANLLLWVAAIMAFMWAFWQGELNFKMIVSSVVTKAQQPFWNVKISKWAFVWIILAMVILFFRLYRLDTVPPEMVSDHAEKLLDVSDVLSGQTSIFFPRNTGREAFQMYLTAAVALVFGTGLSFLSLKIGTVIAGLITLPYIYLLGKELGNRTVGLAALGFAGVAYWPNVISRIALRFTLYPLFVAPVLYYLVRGLRTSNRNDFLLAGLFLGLGLHGYSPFRIVPFLVVIALLLFIIHRQSKGYRRQAVLWLIFLVVISVIVFLPLMRYALENPEMFSYRAMTRLGSLEKPLDAPVWQIFFQNLWKALIMFAWDNGEVWVLSVTHRPALSLTTGVLYHLGLVLVVLRYLRNRNWEDALLLLSIPLLMLPSILSLAFPAENPILNRTAGVIIPVFLLVGIAFEAITNLVIRAFTRPWAGIFAWIIGGILFVTAARHDFELVFHEYQQNYTVSAWNTSEMGEMIRAFSETIGTPESAWVVAYPHWVDTRLVGINAGYPTRDYAIWPDQFNETLNYPGTKLFLIKTEDLEATAKLREIYPLGSLKEHTSDIEGKSFWMYFVPNTDSHP